MRRVELDGLLVLGEGSLPELRLNSPPGGWFPALQELYWCITESNLSHIDMFFSPNLRKIFIHTSLFWAGSEVPYDIHSAVTSAISALPTSALQSLLVGADRGTGRQVPWACFNDAFSSVILRCGSSFTQFTFPTPLSDAAVDHLLGLPRLRTWRVEGPPPNYSASSLPRVFPPLTEFILGGGRAREWLSLVKRVDGRASAMQDVSSLPRLTESLESLAIEGLLNPIIDNPFASQVQMFRNLGSLHIRVDCTSGQCNFKLNNDKVTELATVLRQLKSLLLGYTCRGNTCATTVACLLPISVYCLKLEHLEIHFNTSNIVDDLENVSVHPRFQELRSLPRCKLACLDVWRTPLPLDEAGSFETVANGLVGIFPSLLFCQGFGVNWSLLNRRIAETPRQGYHRSRDAMAGWIR